jgi:VWFA-related protein
MLPLIVSILAVLTVSPSARAADEPPSFGESIDVRVVNVEAVVTDRAGNRVTGLKPGDFRLRVDGKEVPVEYFSDVQAGQALAAAPAEAGKAEGEAALPGLTQGAVGTYYLVFIDEYFLIAANRDVVLKGIKADLGRLGPDDRMAIVAYDGGRLAMLSNWSSSQADLAQALDKAMARRSLGGFRRGEHATELNDQDFADQAAAGDGDSLPPAAQPAGLTDIQRAYAKNLIRQVKGDVQAAVSTLRAFAAPHGRKVMLLVSGGWPFSVASYIGSPSPLPTKELTEGEELFRSLASTANLLGYTLYPVDAPGVQSGAVDINDAAPEMVKAPSRSTTNVVTTGLPGDPGLSSPAEQEIEGSLKFLAQETGGKPLLNTNRTLALATAREDTRSFYWLGFSPGWKHDDKLHSIKLETRRSDLRVRNRTGFLDLSRKAEVSMMVESALLFGNPPGALQMPLKVGSVTREKRGEVEIAMTLGLPVDVMTVVPDGARYDARLELRFAASDADGNSSEIPIIPVDLTSDHPPTPGKVVRYDTKIKLRGKADHLVVAVYDPLSGKIATAETDVK